MIVLRFVFLYFIFAFSSVSAAEFSTAKNQADQLQIGLNLIQKQKYKQAELHFQTLNKRYPDQVLHLNNLAAVLMAQNKTEQALEYLKNAVAMNKNYSVMQKNINKIYAYMASEAYLKALADSTEISKNKDNKTPVLALITKLEPVVIVEKVTDNSEGNATETKTDNIPLDLEKRTDEWVDIWARADIKSYLSIYSKKFQPANNLSYQEWSSQRRYRLRHSKQVKVSYKQLEVFVSADKMRAIVEFVQHYQAGKYQDKVKKQLHWILEEGSWLISRELVTEKFD